MTKLATRLGLARYQADERYHASLKAYAARDLESAKEAIEASIGLLPKHAEYHAALGYFLLEAKDPRLAKEAFERALALNPFEMLANYGQGLLAYRNKDWKLAAGYFTNALAAQPERAETQYYLAMICHRLGRNMAALEWMQSAAGLFLKAADRRERHCHAWIREFERLI
ncbi:MAG: tetratricopeptide repeat protein [Chloroflexota bacterium]|nr:tetratricopeptide repeat protein [Chloroflexota bacterium]MDE2945902.1 tetratricopeptide repeat protein [Chloroflexota bacterium]